jgi:hypothetical protein
MLWGDSPGVQPQITTEFRVSRHGAFQVTLLSAQKTLEITCVMWVSPGAQPQITNCFRVSRNGVRR